VGFAAQKVIENAARWSHGIRTEVDDFVENVANPQQGSPEALFATPVIVADYEVS
jgi:hypothetical protein